MESVRYVGVTAALVAIVFANAGCGALRSAAPGGSAPAERLVWPPPPDPPRIEWVHAFSRASDLGVQRSVWRRVVSVLTGGGGEGGLVRPAGVAATAERIAVADSGSRTVQIYDLPRRRVTELDRCAERRFRGPVAVAFGAGRLYVGDGEAGRIDVFAADGDCLAEWDMEEGARPVGLAFDPARGRLYVADSGLHRVVAYDEAGQAVAWIGRRGSDAGEFNYPAWVAVDAEGDLYVTDALNFRVQIFDPAGTVVGTFGEHGNGSGDMASPKGVGIGQNGEVYLVDALFDAVQLFDREGRYLMSFGSRGTEPGRFWLPSDLAVFGDRIYVSDAYNQRVQVFRFLGGVP